MTVYEYPKCILNGEKIPECALALGFFDGVHIAHRDLLCSARQKANEIGLPFGIFTFVSDTGIKSTVPRLYSDSDKLTIFDLLGADIVIMADFSQIRDLSPDEFVNQVLIEDCGCRCCVAGFNFRFGKGASAGADELSKLIGKHGYDIIIKDEMRHGDDTVSTSLIRSYMASGKIEDANLLLGAPYFIKGKVEHGNSEGHKLGYPTVNISLGGKDTLLRCGVYRSAVAVLGKIYSSVTNIGICPTFEERDIHSETYIFDFNKDIYGADVTVYLLGFLRDEERFSTPKELTEQINKDKEKAIKENGEITWQELGLNLR